ncbi:NlpC/P60 family protein [Sporosarcina thermotolerans]|uniref:NlpC/P60 family protein n=1 Tax=Sporosarcina thermotolerans TaxID=633404 RepID=UPI0024BC1259|nr:NlpC/P60 family protein [Sporosarcina thermotolerans]WHT49179.1 NlpC/P60 family protein [Sporosarcina thermotolerans]
MKKTVLGLLFIVYFLFASVYVHAASPTSSDVPTTHSASKEIEYLVSTGILTESPAFGINKAISRIEAAEMIVKALGIEAEALPNVNFIDVDPEDEFYTIVQTAVSAGFMVGNGIGEFMPEAQLTRAQAASILVAAFKMQGKSESQFRDVPASYWASDAIGILIENEITFGYSDGTFRPNTSLTKGHFSIFLARILNPEFRIRPACYSAESKKSYAINVPVTNVWRSPGKTCPIDEISIQANPDIKKWTSQLTIPDKNWLIGRTDTQVLYGDAVEIIKTSGNWHYIAIKDQAKTGHTKGYEGWVPKSHVAASVIGNTDCPIAIVNAKFATLYNVPKWDDKQKWLDVSYSTILPVIAEHGEFLEVLTVDGSTKFTLKRDVSVHFNYAAVPKPTAKDIVDSAKQYLGLPYVWAGISALGFDCSGLTYSVYKNHGILIPRDSFVQATQGKAVSRSQLQPGDLLFFAHNGGKGQVYHVSLYIGDGKMIHAPNSSRSIEIISIDTPLYKKNYSGARRYLASN